VGRDRCQPPSSAECALAQTLSLLLPCDPAFSSVCDACASWPAKAPASFGRRHPVASRVLSDLRGDAVFATKCRPFQSKCASSTATTLMPAASRAVCTRRCLSQLCFGRGPWTKFASASRFIEPALCSLRRPCSGSRAVPGNASARLLRAPFLSPFLLYHTHHTGRVPLSGRLLFRLRGARSTPLFIRQRRRGSWIFCGMGGAARLC